MISDSERLAALRRSYELGSLDVSDVDPDPIVQIGRWLTEATGAGIVEPNAMVLATADADGTPSARTVLLKGLDELGLVFFSQRRSRKGRALLGDPRAGLVFPWHAMDRQVTVVGTVSEVDRAQTQAYFDSRPWGSRIAVWASDQSQVLSSRADLEGEWARFAEQWPEGTPVPLPEHWTGFRVVPVTVELWQGRRDRLHDRLRYRRAGSSWVIERLAP